MTPDDLRAALESDYETELSRLGSSKSMYAATAGEMEADAVREAMADRAHAAAETFDGWAANTTDTVLADVYGSVAAELHAQVDRIGELGSETGRDRPPEFERYLRTLDSPAERAGGLLGWALVTDETYSQAVGFFVGNADPSAASVFRELRSDLEAERERIEAFVADVCSEDADWNLAREAAAGAIEAAYDHYVETLEDLGVKVKPVC